MEFAHILKPEKQQGFFNLILKEQTPLQRFAFNLTRNQEDAEDLLQDTYLKAVAAQDKVDNFNNLKSWLFTVMKNTFINNYRKNKKRSHIFSNGNEKELINRFAPTNYDQINSRFETKDILDKIKQLDELYRIPFVSYYNGHNYNEIACSMGISVGTVKSRIFTARKRLKKELQQYN